MKTYKTLKRGNKCTLGIQITLSAFVLMPMIAKADLSPALDRVSISVGELIANPKLDVGRDLEASSILDALRAPNFLLKIIPHVDGTPRICELVRYYTTEITLKGAWTGPCSLELHPHALAPVADLPVLQVLSAQHFVADLTLELGEVVYDYL